MLLQALRAHSSAETSAKNNYKFVSLCQSAYVLAIEALMCDARGKSCGLAVSAQNPEHMDVYHRSNMAS